MSDYPMLISNKLHSFRNFIEQTDVYVVLSITIMHRTITLLNGRKVDVTKDTR